MNKPLTSFPYFFRAHCSRALYFFLDRSRRKKGITLVAAIMMMTFLATAISMTSIFVIAQIDQTMARQLSAQAMELAQAGVYKVIYDYRTREAQGTEGYYSTGQQNVDADDYFVIGAQAGDALMVNISGSTAVGNAISNVWVKNASTAFARIDWLQLTWNDPTKILNCVRYNGSQIWPTGAQCNGSAGSQAWINILDQPVTGGDNPREFQFFWDGNISAATVSVLFWMSDETSNAVQVFPGANDYHFTIRSMGKPAGAGAVYRSVKAQYNALTGTIQKYEEINETLP